MLHYIYMEELSYYNPYCFPVRFISCKTRTRRSLCTIAMRTKQSVSKCEWTSSVLLPTYLYR